MSVKARVYLDGAIAGIIGAAIIALLFLFMDVVTHVALYTPSILGAGLFVSANDLASTEGVRVSLKLTLMYTGVHGLVFIVLGVMGAQFLLSTRSEPNLALSILVLFVVLEFGFVATAFLLAAPVLDLLDWVRVLVGNSLAAIGMAIYLSVRHPKRRVMP